MSRENLDLGSADNIDVIDQFLDLKDQFVIDAGCGAMELSKALAQRGARVLAIDPDPIQAEKNEQAEVIANVGFARTGAEAIPVEPGSVDGVFFSYSLHHVPATAYPLVFTELARILKPEGFREAAQSALETLAIPYYQEVKEMTYEMPVSYASWEDYQSKYVSSSYNTQSYSAADVQSELVKSRFLKLAESTGYKFKSPIKVTYMRGYAGHPA